MTRVIRKRPAWKKRNPGYVPMSARHHGVIREIEIPTGHRRKHKARKSMLRNLAIALVLIFVIGILFNL